MEPKTSWIENKYTLNYVVNGKERGYVVNVYNSFTAFIWGANALPGDKAEYEATFYDIQKAQVWVEDKIAKLDSADNFN